MHAGDIEDLRAAIAALEFADVQARATAVTDADDRDLLIQAIPMFRDIVAAWTASAARGSA